MTAIRSPLHDAIGSVAAPRLSLAIADANWFTTENLFREVEREDVATLLLNCQDVRNAWNAGLRPWQWRRSLRALGPALWRHDLVLPSGWMKAYPRIGMRPIASSIRRWHRRTARSRQLALVMTYPFYRHLREMVRPDYHVYYNLDDYALYWPGQSDRIRELERQVVRESDLTICVARVRAEELREAVPEASDRIRHLPHGAPTASLSDRAWERPAPPPEDLAGLPRPLLGYIGSLEDRLDWDLLARLSESMPEASIILIGREPPRDAPWAAGYRRCVERPNVHALGWRPQSSINAYNRSFDVCLIPYRVDHPFNLACSPTKIMDYMVTGRPIVSTALPECRLYESLFHVAADHESFIAAVGAVVDAASDDGRAGARYDWARTHTCRQVVDRLIDWLPTA